MTKGIKFPKDESEQAVLPIVDVKAFFAPAPSFTANAIGIAKDSAGRFHLYEVTFDPLTLQPGKVTSIYSDMIEEDVRGKFQVESARRDFDWGGY